MNANTVMISNVIVIVSNTIVGGVVIFARYETNYVNEMMVKIEPIADTIVNIFWYRGLHSLIYFNYAVFVIYVTLRFSIVDYCCCVFSSAVSVPLVLSSSFCPR